ncbi:MAG: helix-turn-helix domain-containing protein [Candidatus Paceibacterota bacterium]
MLNGVKTEQQNIYENLVKSGLSENESKVFLVLLMLGKGTVTQITRKAGLNRTTGYDILDNLVAKGLASISGKEPKQEYLAESPDKMVYILEKEINEKNKQLKKIKNILPEMKSLHNVAGRPKVRFYEGIEGLKDVYEDTLTSTEPIRAYASVGDMHTGLPGYFPGYYKRRASKGISIRAIIPDTEAGVERKSVDSKEMRETALVPKETFLFSPEINIYDDKVMIASWKEKLGIIIESHEIADAMKKVYELAWAEAKRLDAQCK